jgi:hypothetical protein
MLDTAPLRDAYRELLDAVASGTSATYDNRMALDSWTIDRLVARAGGSAGLRDRIRSQGDSLCAFGGPALSKAELDTLVPTLLLSNDTVLVDELMPLRDLITGLAEVELPAHARQLLALLPGPKRPGLPSRGAGTAAGRR